jgi:hypothetical protein
MLLWFVIIYWIISVAIGLYAARWVHSTKDYAIAGRRMPMYIVTATVFATWFGSETVLGIPATFIKDGLSGIIADPFGSSLCLILVGLFFARPLYRMNLLTIGDYYRKRYSRPVEMLTTLCIVISYLGWVGAQIPVARVGDDHRRLDGARVHDARRHVLGGDHRLHPDDHHRAGHALHRLRDERAGSRGRDRRRVARRRER